MADYIKQMKSIDAEKAFFIGVDSDGCVFDSMELKHKECFAPAFINHFNFQPASKYAREAWEFVNLYSVSRGCNRFHAVIKTLDLLRRRNVVRARVEHFYDSTDLETWVADETKLSEKALEAYLEDNTSEALMTALHWSRDVSEAVRRIVHGVPPIPGVRRCLEKMYDLADVMVVSQTPGADIEREWSEHGLSRYARFIAGQEYGTKTEHIQYGGGGKYAPERMLMIGDAPGDKKAAKDNGILFFPIIAGREDASWRELETEGLDRFLRGTFAGAYEDAAIKAFEANLPEAPSWND